MECFRPVLLDEITFKKLTKTDGGKACYWRVEDPSMKLSRGRALDTAELGRVMGTEIQLLSNETAEMISSCDHCGRILPFWKIRCFRLQESAMNWLSSSGHCRSCAAPLFLLMKLFKLGKTVLHDCRIEDFRKKKILMLAPIKQMVRL